MRVASSWNKLDEQNVAVGRVKKLGRKLGEFGWEGAIEHTNQYINK